MATAKIKLYTSKQLKDGTYPVVLLITHQYKRKKFSLGLSCLPEQWDDDQGLFRPEFPNYKKRNRLLQKTLFRAEDIIDRFQEIGLPFSWEEFNDKFAGTEAKEVFPYFDEIITRLDSLGKAGNAAVYRDAKRALAGYHESPTLTFSEITVPFLIKYEEHLRKKGALANTISTYLRTLRALFNKAITEKKCPPECYPFKEYKVSKLKNDTTKRAISEEEIQGIIGFQPDPNTKQELSKNLFLFSYFMMGMNYNDIAKLRWENVSGDRIEYRRSKTGRLFSVKILPPVQEILEYYQELNAGNPYVFPILDASYQTPEQIRNRIKSGLKRLNKHLKEIGRQVGVDKPLTSYVARHSWATILKRKGVPTGIISEGMGHHSEETTQIYLDSFGRDALDEANERLLKKDS